MPMVGRAIVRAPDQRVWRIVEPVTEMTRRRGVRRGE